MGKVIKQKNWFFERSTKLMFLARLTKKQREKINEKVYANIKSTSEYYKQL